MITFELQINLSDQFLAIQLSQMYENNKINYKLNAQSRFFFF